MDLKSHLIDIQYIYIYILFKLNYIPYKNAYYVNLEIASTSIETYI